MKLFAFYLYAGFLSFMCAEVFAGSSPYWIVSPWAWFLTYPLYMSHFLFFCSLASLTKRVSTGSLYLWGVLFGLYETWVTKVVWAGYPNEEGVAVGEVFGFGIHETFGLVLFYHPVASFLIPLTVLTSLSPAIRREFASLSFFSGNEAKKRVCRYALVLIFSLVTAFNLPGMIGIVLTWVPSLFVCYAGYRFFCSDSQKERGYSLSFSVRSTAFLGGGIICFYVISYFAILPERAPDVVTLLLTLVLYGFIFFLIYRKDGENTEVLETNVSAKVLFSLLVSVFVFGLFFGSLKLLIPSGILFFAVPIFLSFIPLGLVLFFILGVPRKV